MMGLTYRQATLADAQTVFAWANDETTRANSYNNRPISFADHLQWFEDKISSNSTQYLIFELDNNAIGQVRIDKTKDARNQSVISISIDSAFRGKGLSPLMLDIACSHFQKDNPSFEIKAYVFTSNTASYKSFIKSAFMLKEVTKINGIESFILIRMNSKKVQ